MSEKYVSNGRLVSIEYGSSKQGVIVRQTDLKTGETHTGHAAGRCFGLGKVDDSDVHKALERSSKKFSE